MFQFPGCPPRKLWIHLRVSRHCPGRVPPFGDPRISACLQLPVAFRSLPRPSSAVGALASTLCSSSLDFFVAFLLRPTKLNMSFRFFCSLRFRFGLFRIFHAISLQLAFDESSLPVQLSRCVLSLPFPSSSDFSSDSVPFGEVVGRSRLELPTSRLSGECSNRLS